MADLKPCPFCGVVPYIGYACGEYFIVGANQKCIPMSKWKSKHGTGWQDMTISELRDWLAKYTGDGKGDAYVLTCDSRYNPQSDGNPIVDILFIETRSGDCKVVLQTNSGRAEDESR